MRIAGMEGTASDIYREQSTRHPDRSGGILM